jgi:hypothetical protein
MTPAPAAAAQTPPSAAGAARRSTLRGPEVVLQAACALLEQCAAFVREIPDAAYAAEATTVQGGTIGKHLRHVLDHYAAALDASGLDAAASDPHPPEIDYDHRERDVPMESSRAAALARLGAVRARIESIDGAPSCAAVLDTPVRVRVMVAGDGAETSLRSTLGRELAFATHHAVHHQAMMKTIAGEFGIQAAPDFGRAPSTLCHERARAVPPAGGPAPR